MEKPALMRERQTERSRTIITCLPSKTKQASTTTNLSCLRTPSNKSVSNAGLWPRQEASRKKQQQLRADQDLLVDRWTKVLAAEEHKLERPSKSYPKRRLLPQLEEEATKPTSPAYDAAHRPPRGRDREASRPSIHAPPWRQSKSTKARGNVPDLRDIMEDKARQTISIY